MVFSRTQPFWTRMSLIKRKARISNLFAKFARFQWHSVPAYETSQWLCEGVCGLDCDKRSDIVLSCNCILNHLCSELEGKKTGEITGPVTFGEVAYQLFNQTMVYLTVSDLVWSKRISPLWVCKRSTKETYKNIGEIRSLIFFFFTGRTFADTGKRGWIRGWRSSAHGHGQTTSDIGRISDAKV